MDVVDSAVDPLREFAKDSVRLVKRCHKPDRKGNFTSLPDPHSHFSVSTSLGMIRPFLESVLLAFQSARFLPLALPSYSFFSCPGGVTKNSRRLRYARP